MKYEYTGVPFTIEGDDKQYLQMVLIDDNIYADIKSHNINAEVLENKVFDNIAEALQYLDTYCGDLWLANTLPFYWGINTDLIAYLNPLEILPNSKMIDSSYDNKKIYNSKGTPYEILSLYTSTGSYPQSDVFAGTSHIESYNIQSNKPPKTFAFYTQVKPNTQSDYSAVYFPLLVCKSDSIKDDGTLNVSDCLQIEYFVKFNGPKYPNISTQLKYVVSITRVYETYGAQNPTVLYVSDKKVKSEDPYSGGGTSGTGGGTGSFDLTGDAVDIPDNPTLSVVDTGFITVYNPTLAQIKNLANYLWSDLFSLDTFKKLFADPMDALIGCLIVPCSVPSAESTVMVGNISTGITMNKTSTEYVTVDCGTVNLKEYWGAYLDYAPYTKVEIYLPYIGTRQLDTDEVMGKALHVVYKVDILNGACIAYIKVGDSVLYQYSGNCGTSIPISASDFTNVINGLINAGTAIGSMVATEGSTAPQAVPQLAATAVNSLKPSIEKSNGLSSTAGMMGIQKPYLIISRPRQCLPDEQVKYTGYPVYISAKLSDVTGYTEIDKIITNNISATENEINEIINLLKTGVYL